MKRPSLLVATVLALVVAGLASAQFRGRRYYRIADNVPPPTEFVVARWKFGTNGAIGHMGWSHNYPEAEMNLNEFIGRTTKVDVEDASFRLLELSSPEIFEYPFAYVSEPGEMELTEAEVANLRGVTPDFAADTTAGAKAAPAAGSAGPPTDAAVGPDAPPDQVAWRFARAFVMYEVGKADKDAVVAFRETATAPLAKSLGTDPPRLPAGTKVPQAKVLNVAGEIDAPDHVLEQCDVVIGSFHSFADPSQYVPAVRNMLRNPVVDIWGHPTLYCVKKGISLDPATLESLVELCREHEVLIEFNRKYGLPPAAMREIVMRRRAKHVLASDAHRVQELRKGMEEL